jgi:uncharacterized phiE125 gp8 family phage protein
VSAVLIDGGETPISLAEARDALRLGPGFDDAAVAGLIRAATNLCEAFTGQMLVVRSVTEEAAIGRDGAVVLSRLPVLAVEEVLALNPPAMPVLVAPEAFIAERLNDGRTVLRLRGVSAAGVRVRYRAGMAEVPGAVPEAIRHGLIRLVAHWHFGGDGERGGGERSGQGSHNVPAVVTALWTPWRRVGLSFTGRGQ